MSKTTKLIMSLLLVVVIALSFGAGYAFGLSNFSRSEEGLDTIEQAWYIILTDYVDRDKLDTRTLSHAAIEGMLESLNDPYASLLEAEQFELGLSGLEGEFEGIGAYVTVKDKQLMIIAPIAGSPAEKAGIKAGDVILEIDGEHASDMSFAEAILRIRGPEGTVVKLIILHEGETEPEEIEIIRSRVKVPSVYFKMEGDIAYINITDFTARTENELSQVLQSLAEEKSKGIILDLRGNPGGLLDIVVGVTSHFLSEGTVVKVRDNKGDVKTYEVIADTPVNDLPMIVMVDNASASGSEVLAGAMQDHERATIAGNITYGKGSVNAFRRLDDGSGLYITTARWLTPSGRLIEGQGIAPDIELELTGEDAVQWAVDYLTNGE
jgi:carboxyl-terminal processing protease